MTDLQNNQNYFDPNAQSRYQDNNNGYQSQQQGGTNNRQQEIKNLQSQLQEVKNNILNSSQNQGQQQQFQNGSDQLNSSKSSNKNKYNSGFRYQQSQQQNPQYYQSQFNGQSDNINQDSNNVSSDQQNTYTYYGLNKNTSNPFNQHNQNGNSLPNFYGPGDAQNYQNDTNKYSPHVNTGFNYHDFEKQHNQEFLNKISKVQERDITRTKLQTHPEQLKEKERLEKEGVIGYLKGEAQQYELSHQQKQENQEQKIFKEQVGELKKLLHNQRLISFSGTTLQGLLFFFMNYMTSNNTAEFELSQKLTYIHVLITLYFITNQLWNFNISRRIFWDFEQIRDSWFTSFMQFFSFTSFFIFLASCIYYIKEFSQLKGDIDNQETHILNYFVIWISTINIFQLLYSTYTTWMVKHPPADHRYLMFD